MRKSHVFLEERQARREVQGGAPRGSADGLEDAWPLVPPRGVLALGARPRDVDEPADTGHLRPQRGYLVQHRQDVAAGRGGVAQQLVDGRPRCRRVQDEPEPGGRREI
jgi:hypothetical protein